MSTNDEYERDLQEEGARWGAVASEQAQAVPPDWRYHRSLRHNVIMHTADIDALLAHVKPGMRTLELGCSSGWLTLAMAQRGADATGIDVSEEALQIARDYYAKVHAETSGKVSYVAADLNHLDLPPESCDLVAIKGTLHHLVRMDHVIAEIHKTLKPGGLLWVNDSDGDEVLSTVLVASALTLVLPTQVSYREKLSSLLKFGLRSPSRVKASMEAEGLSPFEGAGREHDWVKLINEQFKVEALGRAPAFTGYLTAQVKLSDGLALPLLRSLRAVDRLLVQAHILHSSGVVLYARKT
ncbi:MAG: methyltransferase domain-containing protein [Chloroflexi bacterium]|nr:methyltransferase domain-containing protein [Chloroflexota bacterium]